MTPSNLRSTERILVRVKRVGPRLYRVADMHGRGIEYRNLNGRGKAAGLTREVIAALESAPSVTCDAERGLHGGWRILGVTKVDAVPLAGVA